MHTKDFTSLLQLLDVSQQSGILIVEQEGKVWQALLQLQEGKVRFCSIRDRTAGRVLLYGTQALDWLSLQGELQWRLEEYQAPLSNPLSPSQSPGPPTGIEFSPLSENHQQGYTRGQGAEGAFSRPPRRLDTSTIIDHTWPRDARRVFALVDGVRPVEEIARMLHKSLEDTLQVLQELASRGFIQ